MNRLCAAALAVILTSPVFAGDGLICNAAATYSAVYAGDANVNAGQSAAFVQQVLNVPTATSLTSSLNPSTFGTAVTLTARVSPAAATGTIQFFNGSMLLGSGVVSGGTAQLSIATLPAGADSLTAVYGGDTIYGRSTSGVLSETVNKANSQTTLSASPAAQSSAGQTVTFTATVSAAGATGTVKFMDGSVLVGTASVANGVATYATSSLSTGNHSIVAAYQGDSNVNASQSAAMAYKVKH